MTTTTITARINDGRTVQVPADPTTVPGLYVTTAVPARPGFKTEWRLTHGPSGTAFPYWGRTTADVQSLARALGKVRADWSNLPADVEAWPDGLQAEANRAGAAWECRHHRRSWPEFFWPTGGEATT